MKHFWFWPFIIVVGGSILYLLYVWLVSWLEFKNAPREEMHLCYKHGAIRKQHLIYFAGTPYCPMCFHERLKSVEHPQ